MKVNITPHPTAEGAYYVEYRPDGAKGRRVREPFETYVRAYARKVELENNINRKAPTVIHPRIKDVYEEYLSWVKDHQSPHTYASKKRAFDNRIIPFFGRYRLRDLSMTIFDNFHRELAGKKASTHNYQACLMALVKWMIQRKMGTPLDFKPTVPKYHAPKPIIPSMTDIQAVIDYIEHPGQKALLLTMLWTGLRWNEARLLRWEDVYLDRKRIRVRESDTEAETHVSIYPEMMPWFTANKKRSGWVFESNYRIEGSNPWHEFRNLLRRISKKLGVDIKPHDFRRRSGQNVYEASGYDILAAQRHLRHKTLTATMRYLGISEDRQTRIEEIVIAHVDRLRKNMDNMDN